MEENNKNKQIYIEDGTMSQFGLKNKAEVIVKESDFREKMENKND